MFTLLAIWMICKAISKIVDRTETHVERMNYITQAKIEYKDDGKGNRTYTFYNCDKNVEVDTKE